MSTLWQDIRYGFRMLARSPGFTVVVVLTLSLGIGASTAIFTVTDRVLLDPLPAQDADRLVQVGEVNPVEEPDLPVSRVSPALFLELAEQQDLFEDLVAYNYHSVPLFGGDFPRRLDGYEVTSNFFEYLGVQPILGRTFLPEEGLPGHNRVVVISHGFWQRRFGCDPHLIGRTLIFGSDNLLEPEAREPHTVIGIMPANFQFPRQGHDYWVPGAITKKDASEYPRFSRNWDAMARLKPGVSLRQAQAVLDTMSQRLAEDFPETNEGWQIRIRPLRNLFTSDKLQQTLYGLLGAIVFVLLIACANAGNLLLARSERRQKEIAIRMALGAGRFRLIRQLLTEAILLALLAGGLGLLLTYWGIDLLTALIPGSIPRLQEINSDIRVLGTAIFVSVLTGVGFGLVPAWQSFNPRYNEALKEGRRTVSLGFGRLPFRNLLVGAEVALSLVLLIGAGLFVQSVVRLLRVDPGFDPRNLIGFQVETPQIRYESYEQTVAAFGQREALYKQLADRFRSLPGVQSVGLCRPRGPIDYEVVGRTTPVRMAKTYCGVGDVDYFRTMRIPLLQGRSLTEADADRSPKGVVINESVAKLLWPGENPLGKRFKRTATSQEYMVVGVAGDVKEYRLDQEPYPRYYLPFKDLLRHDMPFGIFMIRTHGNPLALASAIRNVIWELMPNSPAPYMWTVEKDLKDSTKPQRTYMLFISFFASIGLVLAAVGIYGVMSYVVARRTQEIGIRMALGACRSDVLKLVVKKGLTLILIGLAVGVAGAMALTRVIAGLLYGVSPTDPVTLIVVCLLLMVVGLIGCYIPARRAAKVDPMAALRYE